jgi:transposase
MSSEQNDALILALFERVQELQMRVDMNSRNSSKPPSSDGYSKPAPKSQRPQGQRSSGGQKGHPTHTLRQSLRVDKVITHAPPSHCSACRSRLQAGCIIDKRQVFEQPSCACRSLSTSCCAAPVPAGKPTAATGGGINAPVQYGPRAKALVVHLNQHHLVPTARTSALMQDSFGLAINQASVIGCAAQAGGGQAQPHGRQHRRGATKRPRGARR